MIRCQCVDVEISLARLQKSGLKAAFGTKTLENYQVEGRPPQAREAHWLACSYAENFETICKEEYNWLSLLGQVGSGKTHLTIGIANALLDRKVGVVYMAYRDEITRLKQIITDEEQYSQVMNRFKRAQVLVVDDLFKKAAVERNGETVLNESDNRIMFEIINHRYFNRLPLIISSEFTMNGLLNLEESLGSRIFEMTKGRFIEFKGREMNYRLTG